MRIGAEKNPLNLTPANTGVGKPTSLRLVDNISGEKRERSPPRNSFDYCQ